MTATLVGYARCSADERDLASQRQILDTSEFEVDLPRMRAREGMAVATANGKLKGKQPKLSARQQSHLLQQHRSDEHTIADLFSVSRATVYLVLQRQKTAVSSSTRVGQ